MDPYQEDPYFQSPNKRFMFEEDENASKRLKISPYHSFLGNNNGSNNGNNSSDLHPLGPLPILLPPQQTHNPNQDSNHNHSAVPVVNTSQGNGMAYGPVYHYNPGYYGQAMNQETGFLPFNNFLPTPHHYAMPGNSNSVPSPLVPPSQVYYFSSPPFMHNGSMRPHNGTPYTQMNTITTLQHPGNNHIESPLTHMLHSVPLDNEAYDQPLQSTFKYSAPSSNSNVTKSRSNTTTNNNNNASIDKTKKKKIETLKKKEGLEESSVRIINLLQEKGKMVFKDIHETLGIDYRRAYDILNILLTTSLVTKTGKKRENKLPFIYQDGVPLPEAVELKDILGEVAKEEEKIDFCSSVLAYWKQLYLTMSQLTESWVNYEK